MVTTRPASLSITSLAAAAGCLVPWPCLSAQTYWQPPQVLWPRGVLATVPNVLLREFNLGSVRIRFNETTLATVGDTFPGGRYGQSGDAGDYLRWLCYVSGAGAERSVLWLQSDEMGGGTWVMGFALQQVPETASVDSRCANLPASGSALQLPKPLRLGTTRSEVVRLLGPPSYEHGDTLAYAHEHHVPPPQGKAGAYGYDVTSEVDLVLSGDRVMSLQVWYLEST